MIYYNILHSYGVVTGLLAIAASSYIYGHLVST